MAVSGTWLRIHSFSDYFNFLDNDRVFKCFLKIWFCIDSFFSSLLVVSHIYTSFYLFFCQLCQVFTIDNFFLLVSWIMNEYRKEEEQIQALMIESFACPLCKRGTLQKHSETHPITCTLCHLLLPSSVSIDQFGFNLKQNVSEHSAQCVSDPQFTLITECNASSLLMICSTCSLIHLLN